MATRIDDLFEELKAYADDTIKQANALEGIDSMPGSENDKPIPSGAENPDPKVKDETIDRPAKDTIEGAKPGSDFPANNANEMQADQPALTPDKKPLDTADANAKEASVKGNNLVQLILKTKQAAEAKKAEEAQKEAAAKKPAAPVQAAAPAAPATKEAAPADADTIKLDMAMMAKIAAITLADEEGQLAVQQALTKRAGAEFAEEVLDILEKRAAEEQAAWEFEKGAQDAEAMIGDMQEAQGAADAEAAMGDLAEANDAAAAEAGAAGDEGGSVEDAAAALDDYSAEEIVEAVNELAQEGQIPPEQAQAVIEAVTQGAEGEGSPEDISEDDLAEAIVQAVDSGEMTEEDAQALVQAISEGGGDPEADQALAADVAGAGAGEGEAAAEAAPEGGEKAAAAKAEAEKQAAAKAAAEKRASFKAQLVSVLKGKK
jgi:hypothetical protein